MTDFFKVVQTIENGMKKLTVVPSGRENKGILSWPTSAKCDITDPSSKPDSSWRTFSCQLKRTGYLTYEEASDELDNMAGKSDTDDALSNPKRRRMIKKSNVFVDNFQHLLVDSSKTNIPQIKTPAQKKETVFCKSRPIILENRTILPPTKNEQVSPRVSQYQRQSPQINTDPIFNVISVDPSSYNYVSIDPEQLGLQITNLDTGGHSIQNKENINEDTNEDTSENTSEETSLKQLLQNIENKLQERKESEEKIFRVLGRLEAKIDAMAQGICQPVVNVHANVDILKPVETIEEAIELEEALKEEIYFQNIINQMKTKMSKNLRGFNCCYSLVDLFFERSFFNQCSWSGQSRQGGEKYPFKSFQRILNCFFMCIRSVDQEFVFSDCQTFFKDKTLKHSVQREKAISGRISKIKHRPVGIYSKKTKKKRVVGSHNSGDIENNQEKEQNVDGDNKENEGETFGQDGDETSEKGEDSNDSTSESDKLLV